MFAFCCLICPWRDYQYFEFSPQVVQLMLDRYARCILWPWYPALELLSSLGVSMSRFECSIGARTLGKCFSLALDTQRFSTRFAEVRAPREPGQCKFCLPSVHPQEIVIPSLSVEDREGQLAPCWATVKTAGFTKWILFHHVLSTLIMLLAHFFEAVFISLSLFSFFHSPFSFSCFLIFSVFSFSSFPFWKQPSYKCSSEILSICNWEWERKRPGHICLVGAGFRWQNLGCLAGSLT